jgi:hypothetical protein
VHDLGIVSKMGIRRLALDVDVVTVSAHDAPVGKRSGSLTHGCDMGRYLRTG